MSKHENLPKWLQKLWELSPLLARQAESDYNGCRNEESCGTCIYQPLGEYFPTCYTCRNKDNFKRYCTCDNCQVNNKYVEDMK